jgi:hypothetical protein
LLGFPEEHTDETGGWADFNLLNDRAPGDGNVLVCVGFATWLAKLVVVVLGTAS